MVSQITLSAYGSHHPQCSLRRMMDCTTTHRAQVVISMVLPIKDGSVMQGYYCLWYMYNTDCAIHEHIWWYQSS